MGALPRLLSSPPPHVLPSHATERRKVMLMQEEKAFDTEFLLNLTGLLAELGVTDLYLSLGNPLMVRYKGEVKTATAVLEEAKAGEVDLGPLVERIRGAEQLLAYAYVSYIAKNLWSLQRVNPAYLAPLFQGRAMDIGMALNKGYRGRIHAFFAQVHLEADFTLENLTEERWAQLASHLRYVIRIIPPLPPSIEELGLTPVVEQQFLNQRGLYLVVGPTASGKTTTASYLAQSASYTRPWHILTLEDPIEYVIQSGALLGRGGLVHQREKGRDFLTFPEGMRQALRESPDLILVGEIRDEETLNWTLFLAEAGFTVLATYHTSSFVETVQRIVGSFPPEQRSLAAKRLATVLRAVVAQRLVKGKTGMRLIYEYVPVGSTLALAIEEEKPLAVSTDYPWEKSIEYWVAQGEFTPEETVRIKALVRAAPQPPGGRLFRRE